MTGRPAGWFTSVTGGMGGRPQAHRDAAEVEAADELALRPASDRVLYVQRPPEPLRQPNRQRVPAAVVTIFIPLASSSRFGRCPAPARHGIRPVQGRMHPVSGPLWTISLAAA